MIPHFIQAQPPHLRLVGLHERQSSPASDHPGRTLHLLDVENLTGDPSASSELLGHVRVRYGEVVGYKEGDHSVGGCNASLIHRASSVWMPGGQWRVGHGPDGGERSILTVVDAADVSRRFSRVVIGSGDHAFTDLARSLRALDLDVWVAARPGTLSRRLAAEAGVIAWLHMETLSEPALGAEPSGPVAA